MDPAPQTEFVLSPIVNDLPEFNEDGDLPQGVHSATLEAVLARFGKTGRRALIGRRLERIYALARSTGQLARFIVFGSFITDKAEPNDVDIFLLMEDSFDVRQVPAEIRLVFEHSPAQDVLGASVFWIRRAAALGGEEATIAHWQIKRDGGKRGIVEIVAL
jgi:predicted nucleotidyltransferase